MTVQKFQLRLHSAEVKLPVLEELVGKEVEIIIQEIAYPEQPKSNVEAIQKLLDEYASPEMFSQITDPVQWQKDLRDEWER